MSLGPSGRFFLNSHFIFILLTKLFKYYFNLLTTTTERHPPLACEPLARRVGCGMDDGMKATGGAGKQNYGGEGKRNDRRKRERKRGPRDVVDISWAIGKFFLNSYFFFS